MGTRSVPKHDAALDAELAALRSRAYGLNPDIDRDPAALARLTELEAWHAALLAPVEAEENPGGAAEEVAAPAPAEDRAAPAAPRAITERLRRALRSRGGSMVLGAVVATAAVLGVVWASTLDASHPDAVLHRTDVTPDKQALRLADYARSLMVDSSTLEAFDRFRGLTVWSARSGLGNDCVLVMEPWTDSLLAAACAPPGVAAIAEIDDVPVRSQEYWHEGLPVGTVVRFIRNGDAVDVWVYPGVTRG